MGPKCAWYEMFTLPLIIGTPSSRGKGMVKIIPTLVPTHNKPLQAISAVTVTDDRLLLIQSRLLQLFDPGDGDVTRSTFEAILMS